MRIVGRTDNGKACIAQSLGIAPLLRVRQSIAHIGKILMAVGTYQLVIALAIQPKALLSLELKRTDSYLGNAAIERLPAILDAGGYII